MSECAHGVYNACIVIRDDPDTALLYKLPQYQPLLTACSCITAVGAANR